MASVVLHWGRWPVVQSQVVVVVLLQVLQSVLVPACWLVLQPVASNELTIREKIYRTGIPASP